MRNFWPSFILSILITLPLPAYALNSITVMADSSFSVALSLIAREYARQYGVIVNTAYGSPKSQQAMITEGEAADVVITPVDKWIDDMKLQGLVDVASRTPLAKGKLVLAGPKDSPIEANLSQAFPIAPIIQQLGNDPGFVIGNPEALPEGSFAREAMQNMKASADLEEYTLYIKQQSQMVQMVKEQGAYGIFLTSSIAGQNDIRVLDDVPESTHRPIQYYGVVVAGENMDEARKFLEYLKSNNARKVLEANGFLMN